MASESEDGCPSGLGQAMRLAAQAAKSGGDPSNIAIKAATIKQLTAILAVFCARPGFPTVNRHLRVEELAGLGWLKLQPLLDDPQKGKDMLTSCISTLVTLSHPCNFALQSLP